MDHNSQGRRPHFHRGRRGPDRRGNERRQPPPPQEPAARGDHADVEQIMRDIRARIAKNHGIELSAQQIQELAARRLEAILDPRTMKPGLMDQLRKGAGAPAPTEDGPAKEASYTFDDTSMFGSHRGLLRVIRSLLNPILKLFFNPAPLVHALKTQAALNAEAAVRDADRDRRQAEWNALHYELVQRLVTETARVSIEMQSLSMRVEALSGKVDFNERRVRTMESASPQQSRPAPRPVEPYVSPVAAVPVPSANVPDVSRPPSEERPAADGIRPSEGARTGEAARPADGQRRKRRRRRGRRSGGPLGDSMTTTGPAMAGSIDLAGGADEDDADGDDGPEADLAPPSVEHAELVAEAPDPQQTAIRQEFAPAPRLEEASPAAPVEPAPSAPQRVDHPESDPSEG